MASRSGGLETPDDEERDIRKALFQSPKYADVSISSVSGSTKALMSELQIEHDMELSMKMLKKDQHEQRIRDLRTLQKQLQDDEWRYPSVEKLIGLH